MSLVSELEKLEQLHQSGSLSQHEFAIAKRKLLNEDSHDQQVADSQVVKIQNDIEELDRSWLIEREKYMSSAKFGKQRAPSKSGSITYLIWISFAASCFIVPDICRGQDLDFPPIFALTFIVPIVIGVIGYKKATNYELAEAVYQKKRKELLARKAAS
ncbi:SHOCT domain-containing protein [Persicirhabdus sediminis]|uniref:SHOCT domain-containing protein n=1 Tax=Persicirhabdus sediminis TaxID=454144 RepID=A0A8J7MCQ6_9BACT|nr:SHOCT domain-containing protein [Persicirhabdus sediminis]MBK1790907.1 SHOCT domain-containing protein [Persicirhabdus sediminis]